MPVTRITDPFKQAIYGQCPGRPCKYCGFLFVSKLNETTQNSDFLEILPTCTPVDFYGVLAAKGLASDILVLWRRGWSFHRDLAAYPGLSAVDGLKESPTLFGPTAQGEFVASKRYEEKRNDVRE